MASTTSATTVLYGTPWTDDNILEKQRLHNIEEEKRTGCRLNFEAPWQTLGAMSAPYRDFVQGEIDRLGESHPTIRTQYLLQPVSGAGRLFPFPLIQRMQGDHPRQPLPLPDRLYVAGIDVAGQVVDHTSTRSSSRVLNERDETVVTIAEVDRSAGQPVVRVVEHYRWRGISHAEQYDRLLHLLREVWNPMRVAVDATGVGAGLASFLHRALPTRVDPVAFTVPTKSELGFALLAAAETGRLKVYRHEGGEHDRELWRQLEACRYKLAATEEMSFSVPVDEGHDDFVMSLALAVRAAASVGPLPCGSISRAPQDPADLGW